MPIEEYAKEAPAVDGTPVLVEIKSTQSDLTVGFFNVKRSDPMDRMFDESENKVNNEYSLVSEGLIRVCDGRLSVSYEETAIEDVAGCTTVISFDISNPDCVTVERCGPLSSVFVISKGERLFSVYSTPYGALDMCVYAKKVENCLTENGGTLMLDYAVELKGLTAQRTRMEVKVREL